MAWQHYRNFSLGSHFNNSDAVKRPEELKLLNGCNVDYKIGSIVKDLGYSQIGNLSSGNDITGLYNFRQSAATQKMLITTNNTADTALELYYSTGGNVTEVTDAETAWNTYEDAKVEMETMDGYCYFVGYDSTDSVWLPVASFTGTTFSTSANVTSMPNAKYVKRYRDRIYIGNCNISSTAYPYRVYYSTVPSSSSITWTVATNFLDVDYGEYITGLGENWDRLAVFTEYSTYMYNQSEWKKMFDVGCSSHRTIKNSGAYMIWANWDGVWLSTGGRPLNIINKMSDFFKGGSLGVTNYFAEVVDEEYWLYIGNATVENVTYTNVVLIYNIPHQTWRIRELADNPKIFAKYNSSGKIYLWHGDADGEIMQYAKYSDSTPIYADDGIAIKGEWQTISLDFGQPQDQKFFDKIIAYTERGQGLELYARIVDNNNKVIMEWKELGQCKKFINEFTVNPNKGNFLQIKGRDISTNPYFVFDGFSIDVSTSTKK